MATVESNSLVTHFADVPRLNETLPQMVSQLEICQKALSDFLEEKRQVCMKYFELLTQFCAFYVKITSNMVYW